MWSRVRPQSRAFVFAHQLLLLLPTQPEDAAQSFTFWTTFSFCSWLCLSFFSSTSLASSSRSSSRSCLMSCCRSSMLFPCIEPTDQSKPQNPALLAVLGCQPMTLARGCEEG